MPWWFSQMVTMITTNKTLMMPYLGHTCKPCRSSRGSNFFNARCLAIMKSWLGSIPNTVLKAKNVRTRKCAGKRTINKRFGANYLMKAGSLIIWIFPVLIRTLSREPLDNNSVSTALGAGYAHSTNEILYHPSSYKTQLCVKKTVKKCPWGHLCSKYHKNDNDVRDNIILNSETGMSKSLTESS